MELTAGGVARRVLDGLGRRDLTAARDQAVVAAGQLAAGLGNLAFALVMAHLLAPGAFAQIASFLALYSLLGLPGTSISAAASLRPQAARRARRLTVAGGAAIGLALAAGSPWVGPLLRLPVPMVLVIGLAGPALGTLALERGRLYGTRAHPKLVGSLLAEPAVRLSVGIALATLLGAVGGAVGVVVGGYAALELARSARRHWWRSRGRHARGAAVALAQSRTAVDPRAAATPAPAVGSTAATFLLFAVVQNQDLLIANRVLPPAAAGQFAVLSTLGGLAAFASLTVPLVLLPRTAGGDERGLGPALGLSALLGGGALLGASVVPGALVAHLFGARYAPVSGLVAPYLLAMALLGVGRVLAAHRCGRRAGRTTAALVAGAAALQAVLIVEFGHDPTAVAYSTLAATATACAALATAVVAVPAARRAAPSLARAVAAVRLRLRTHAAAVAALTALGTVIRFVIPRGLWLDEATSVHEASLSFGGMLADLRATDVHPPLYFTVLWAAIRVFGTGQVAVRLPSIVAGVLTIPVLYLLGKEAYDRRTGLVAACIGAVAPILVWYSQEARMYAMLGLFGLLAMWAQVRILRRWPAGRVGAWPWVVYALASVAMVWTQYFGLLQVVVQQLAFVWALVVHKRRGARAGGLGFPWAAATLVVVVGVVLLMPFAYHQFVVNQHAGRGFGAPQQVTTAASVNGNHLGVYAVLANVIWAVIGYQPNSTMLLLGALWPLGMLLALGLLGRRSQPTTALLVVAVLGPGLALFVLGLAKPYLFDIRYLFPAVVLVTVLVARGLTGFVRHARPLVAVTAVAACALGGFLVNQQVNGSNPRRYDFNTALTTIEHTDHRGDRLLYSPSDLDLLVQYYAPRVTTAPLGARPPTPTGGHTLWVLESRILENGQPGRASVARAVTYLRRHSHLVAVRRYSNVEVWIFK